MFIISHIILLELYCQSLKKPWISGKTHQDERYDRSIEYSPITNLAVKNMSPPVHYLSC